MADAAASPAPAPAAPVAWTPLAGLSRAQVAERRSRGLTNAGGERTSRSVADIWRANIFTRQPVQRPLGPQLLPDADQRVGDQHDVTGTARQLVPGMLAVQGGSLVSAERNAS